eukprot:12747-Eustigmatos_ZCMA.PRE.1
MPSSRHQYRSACTPGVRGNDRSSLINLPSHHLPRSPVYMPSHLLCYVSSTAGHLYMRPPGRVRQEVRAHAP